MSEQRLITEEQYEDIAWDRETFKFVDLPPAPAAMDREAMVECVASKFWVPVEAIECPVVPFDAGARAAINALSLHVADQTAEIESLHAEIRNWCDLNEERSKRVVKAEADLADANAKLARLPSRDEALAIAVRAKGACLDQRSQIEQTDAAIVDALLARFTEPPPAGEPTQTKTAPSTASGDGAAPIERRANCRIEHPDLSVQADRIADLEQQLAAAKAKLETATKTINRRWRDCLTEVFPNLQVMSFAGPAATARWVGQQFGIVTGERDRLAADRADGVCQNYSRVIDDRKEKLAEERAAQRDGLSPLDPSAVRAWFDADCRRFQLAAMNWPESAIAQLMRFCTHFGTPQLTLPDDGMSEEELQKIVADELRRCGYGTAADYFVGSSECSQTKTFNIMLPYCRKPRGTQQPTLPSDQHFREVAAAWLRGEQMPVSARQLFDTKDVYWLRRYTEALIAEFRKCRGQGQTTPFECYKVFKDGDRWCAVEPGFVNLMESEAAFDTTPVGALQALICVPPQPDRLERVAELESGIRAAWGLIANAYDGRWCSAKKEWQNAAIQWRDTWLKTIDESAKQPGTGGEDGAE